MSQLVGGAPIQRAPKSAMAALMGESDIYAEPVSDRPVESMDYNDVKNEDGFLAECRQGREMGFDGKTLIHPAQVEGANAAFAPDDAAVEDARGVLAAWEDGKDRGVVTYQGRMIERLHVDTAAHTLALHEAITRSAG